MEANAARAFQKRVESVADLILTGHEHDVTRRTQEVSTGERNEYVEGGALQDSYSPAESVFNVFVIDIIGRKQKALEFAWGRGALCPYRSRR
jgi:2',3'-cyclic-nucleotide 2'-phosphodiesterase (5'-nucleotidase family)